LKKAPRREDGKVIQGHAYKSVLEGYRENGIEPDVLNGKALKEMTPRAPMFVIQPGLENRIVKLIRRGYPFTTVCRYVGITTKTFREWLDKGKAGTSKDYVRLYRRVAKAEAKAEMKTLEKLRTHENADWRVSAWQLERRWPEHWSKKDRLIAESHVNVTHSGDSKESLSKNVVQDDAARELARKLIDGNDFSYDQLPSPDYEEA
jgi:hypothetical protein